MKVSSTPMLLRSFLAATLAWSAAAQSFDIEERIVGGDEAEPGDYPYFVDMWGCGGALVAPDIVLFAAHCGDTALNMQVNIGAYLPRADAHGSQTRFCDEWIPDPNYTEGPANSDFALCKLDKPVDMLDNGSDKQVFLELNSDESLPASGDPLWVMGLGRTTEGGDLAETLRDVEVPALSNEECNQQDRYMGYITDLMLCAGFPDTGGKDSCQGDSGGPIVRRVERPDGTFVDTHVGVVSWGVGCAREDFPGVYARTSSRYDWIKTTMCDTLGSVSDLCENNDNDNDNDDWREELLDDFVCENADEHLFAVSLTTDKYASETAWLLYETESLEHIKERKYLVNYHAAETKICLKSDTCYTWSIRDGYGDGMCTNSGGCGNYELSLEGVTRYTGDGNFGSEDTFEFCTATKTPPTNVPEPPVEPTDPPAPDSDSDSDEEEEPPVMPTNPPDTPAPTTFSTSVCGEENFDLEFGLTIDADDSVGQIGFAIYSLFSNFTGLDQEILVQENIGADYTIPDEDNSQPICLEDNTCYIFAIADSLEGGDAAEAQSGHVFYAGFLGSEEVFVGGGTGTFSGYEDAFFCTGTASIPGDLDLDLDSDPDTAAPSAYPTIDVTTAPPTDAPTDAPTTSFPTQVPTPEPTSSMPPSAVPSGVPSGAPSVAVTPEATSCEDDPSFRYKKKSKWTCAVYLRGKKTQRIKKRCAKKYKKKFIHEYCPATCGAKAGEGQCSHLKSKKGGRKRKKKSGASAAVASSSTTTSVDRSDTLTRLDDPKVEDHFFNNIFSNTNHDRDRGDWHADGSWLSFSSTTTTRGGDGRFRKLIENKMRRI